jgi:hypothetical protein
MDVEVDAEQIEHANLLRVESGDVDRLLGVVGLHRVEALEEAPDD